MKVGYARVSTVGQSLESQIEQLIEYGCEIIYMEKESGKKTDRQDLDNARKALRKGDKLVVTKIDRLARSVRDLHNIAIEVEAEGEGNKKRPFQIEQWCVQKRTSFGTNYNLFMKCLPFYFCSAIGPFNGIRLLNKNWIFMLMLL